MDGAQLYRLSRQTFYILLCPLLQSGVYQDQFSIQKLRRQQIGSEFRNLTFRSRKRLGVILLKDA